MSHLQIISLFKNKPAQQWTTAELQFVNDYLQQHPELLGAKRVGLIALTWHYGRALSHWGEDIALLKRLFDHMAEHQSAPILRMHDRKRFEPAYLLELERLVANYPEAVIKFKDEARDSLLDLVASDFIISNFSSILNYYYATRKPSIHVYPVSAANEAFLWRRWRVAAESN